jgi:putative endonuclease
MSKIASVHTGRRGEDIACQHLLRAGYKIEARNYRWNRGEIDIIAGKNNLLVFVEVKTARQLDFGHPETWVDERKQQKLAMVAEHYIAEMTSGEFDCRFDVIAVTINGEHIKLKHIEDAFWL